MLVVLLALAVLGTVYMLVDMTMRDSKKGRTPSPRAPLTTAPPKPATTAPPRMPATMAPPSSAFADDDQLFSPPAFASQLL